VARQVYRLCQRCNEREGNGASTFEVVSGRECFVCAGIMDRTVKIAEVAAKKARQYQFNTFSVGVSVPEGVQEREDELRSVMKLKGRETIKTQAARMVTILVAKELGKRVDRTRPDVTLLADFGAGSVVVTSRSIYYYGRYTKPAGVSQRRSFCQYCQGSGCKKCRNSGFEQKASVEEALRRKLAKFSRSEKMTFTWLGSEDRDSRVYAPGRPFVAEVKNPKKRTLPGKFAARFSRGLVSVSFGKVLPSKPVRLPAFRFLTKITAIAKSKVGPEGLAELRSRFRRAEVRFERPHNRPTVKTVYRVSAEARGRTLYIDAELDGGLPVKRFVNGDLVSPSVSEVLKTEVGCRSFDICRVREIGEFGFAEITRSEEKN
jgi:tRNA pseudouridine synthase 10